MQLTTTKVKRSSTGQNATLVPEEVLLRNLAGNKWAIRKKIFVKSAATRASTQSSLTSFTSTVILTTADLVILRQYALTASESYTKKVFAGDKAILHQIFNLGVKIVDRTVVI